MCPEPIPLPEAPAEALVHDRDRSRLPADRRDYEVEHALRVLLRAHVFDMETLSELESKHEALVQYIEKVKK